VRKNPLVRPFLKWAGGKRQLLPHILAALPERHGCYYEPFLGGGAVFFALQPARAVVNDSNPELINCYAVVRDAVEDLIAALAEHKARSSSEHYYAVRAWDRAPEYRQRPAVERAARVIYLNKLCYNGLFRVNRRGEFNVPFGRHANPAIFDVRVLRAVSTYLRSNAIELRCEDFAIATCDATCGDAIYFDPPYDPISPTALFTSYAAGGFGKAEQERLRAHVDELAARGCRIVLNNAYTPYIAALYAGYPHTVVGAARAINSDAARRGDVDEILVTNAPHPRHPRVRR
jgi:DNA adenine methylase